MRIAFTGHRQINGAYDLGPEWQKICEATVEHLTRLNPEYCLSGMAVGYDLIASEICSAMMIPFIACVPYVGHHLKWPEHAQEKYNLLLSKARETVIVSPGGYAAYKNMIRNHYLVDNSDLVLGCFDGRPGGGTAEAVNYAKKVGRWVVIIKP